MSNKLKAIDPGGVDYYSIVWCSRDGTNDGSENDLGELQGATISASSWAISPGGELTEDANNTSSITIRGITYPINTVATIRVSAGVAGNDYILTNQITTSDGRQLEESITVRCRQK